ncbi:MAG: PEP/pyruvate-binding domain-containing protein [Candidatus Woesearchaeota archaeon]
MTFYLQLEKALERDVEEVGEKAFTLAKLKESAHMPFTLVLTSDLFLRFLRENALEDYLERFSQHEAQSFSEQVKLFTEFTEKWKRADFSTTLTEDLRECFELLKIDTSNIGDLSHQSSSVIAIQRSTSYTDTDRATDKLFFVKEQFNEFLDAIKKAMLGIFAPSSQALRKRQGVGHFSQSLVLSTLPRVNACFETSISPNRKQMTVESYVGFYDPAGSIARDTFVLGVEFLKIQDTKIRSQDKVAVFDKENNQVKLQHYMTMGSSQSAPEQVILECGRLSKKILAQTQSPTRIVFMNTPENNVYCITLQLTPEGLPKNEWKELGSQQTGTEPEIGFQLKEFDGVADVSELAEALKQFLKKNQDTKYGPSITIVLRALENKVTADSLSQALLVTKQLVTDKK